MVYPFDPDFVGLLGFALQRVTGEAHHGWEYGSSKETEAGYHGMNMADLEEVVSLQVSGVLDQGVWDPEGACLQAIVARVHQSLSALVLSRRYIFCRSSPNYR